MTHFAPILLDTLPPLPVVMAGMHQLTAIAWLVLACSVVGLFGIAAIFAMIMAQNQRTYDRERGMR